MVEAVGRPELVAARPVAVPVADHVARAGAQAAPAFRPLAQRGFHPAVAFDRGRTEHAGEHDPRAVFRRQQLQVQAQRAEAGLDGAMVEGQERLHRLVRVAPVAPRVDMGRRHDQRRPALAFQPQHQLEGDLLERRHGQFVVIVFVPLVPARDLGDAGRQPLGEHDDPVGVVVRDVGRNPRIGRIGRVGVDLRAVGDAGQVGAEFARLRLDIGGAQLFLEDGDGHGG